MGSIHLVFVGICTHINQVLLTPPPDAYSALDPDQPGSFTRVVLPNASLGYRWGDGEIPPHDAMLWIPKQFVASTSGPLPGLEELDGDAYTWRMRGVRLYATGATGNLTSTDPSYRYLPSLTKIANRVGVQPLDLDPRVVLEGRAAAVVDLFGGTRDAYRNPFGDRAVVGKFTVQTDTQRLIVERIRDKAQGFIQLQDAGLEPVVIVSNTGRNSDVSVDFFLHYFATTWAPTIDAQPPGPETWDGLRDATDIEREYHRNLPQGLTYGCSNSNYP